MKRAASILSFTFALLFGALAQAQAPAIAPAQSFAAHNGMVVAQERRAARIGVDILKRGGNAVDAAVAVGFALAVTYPRAGNIGGGGFMVIHLAKGRDTSIDYRETAPAAASKTLFLDAAGNADAEKSRDSGLSVGVPGTVAGLALAEKKYGSGKFTLAALIAPAIDLARNGFPVADDLADSLPGAARLLRYPSSAAIFVPGGQPLKEGERLLQFDLADTLQKIADGGPRAFYSGRVAQRIADAVQQAGGIMTARDLAAYKAVERPVVRGSYRGYDIVSMPPPSSGGICLIEMLNILEGYDLAKIGRNAQSLHYLIEAMKRAYADRAVFLGDPDFVQMPTARLTSKKYAAAWRAGIGEKSTPAAQIRPGKPGRQRGPQHHAFLRHRPRRQCGVEHLYPQLRLRPRPGGARHRRAAQQRARRFHRQAGRVERLWAGRFRRQPAGTEQAAALLDDADHRAARTASRSIVTGSPGGSRIISAVLQVITNVIDFHMGIGDAVSAPRLHNQWEPDKTFVEPGFDPALLEALERRGHIIVPTAPHTDANSILVTKDGYVGAADRRTRGATAAGY